jgi:hypothetical protein
MNGGARGSRQPQTDYEHHWLINPDTGEIAFWTASVLYGASALLLALLFRGWSCFDARFGNHD